MFGCTFKIIGNNLNLILRPAVDSDVPKMTKDLSDWEVRKYLGFVEGLTENGEREWIKRTAEDRTCVTWLIQPEGMTEAIGSTGLHKLNDTHSCVSGLVIWDKNWWRKGVAYTSHIGRTWFAAKQMAKYTITSFVFSPNIGSWKALEKVGYTRTGIEPVSKVVNGTFVDKYIYTWINPIYTPILFSNGIPKEYASAIQKAKDTLELGDAYIKYV